MGFKLVRVDTTESCKVSLPLGSHFIGRGKFLDCNDHRVSRRHAELIVTTESILLKSLHQNPCFVRKKATKNTVIFCQPESQVLSNGDQFGLIPDTYWYEVIYCLENLPTDTESVEKATEEITMNEDSNTESYDHDDQENIRNLGGSIMTEFLESPHILSPRNDPDGPDSPQADRPEVMDISTHQPIESPDQPANWNDQPTTSNDQNGEPINQPADSTDSESTVQSVESHVCDSNSGSPGKRPHSEESSPCDIKKVKTEPVTQTNENNGTEKRSSGDNAASSDQVVKIEPSSPQDVKPGPSNDQGGSSNDNNKAGPAPQSPTKPLNKPLRERCMYGVNCYRRNPAHKATYSHPTDPDWGPGARAECPYGAACAKRDPRHWRDHAHPPGAAPPVAPAQRPGRRRRRQRSATPESNSASGSEEDASTLIVAGKRARKTIVRQGWSDSEDEDPFGTDESDEWEPPSNFPTSQDYSQSQDL